MPRKRDYKARPLTGEALKSFKHNQAILYKKGLAKKGAKQQQVTRYALGKQRKLKDVIEGRAVALKAAKNVRSSYVDKGLFSSFGSRLIVPKEHAKQRTKISKGLLTITTPLKNGEEQRIIFPYSVTDMQGVIEHLKSDPTLGGVVGPEDQLGFRVYGHNSQIGFPETDELVEYIERRYQHLFKPGRSHDAFKHFQLVRFNGFMPEGDPAEKFYTERRRGIDAKGRSTDSYSEQKRRGNAGRVARFRERMTPEQREQYLAKARIRSAQNRQRKFEDK